MAHLGTVYDFRLYDVEAKEYRLLGSIDGKGSRLCDDAPYLLEAINHTVQIDDTNGPQPSVTFKSSVPVNKPHQCAAIMNKHEYGSRGELNRHAEGDIIPFYEEDNQQFEVAIVISAPPMNSVGFIGFHAPNRRSIKTGVETELRRMIREEYDLKLELQPVIPINIMEAISREGIGYVTFRKLNNPRGLFNNESDRWARGREVGSVDLHFKPNRNGRLFDMGKRISRFLQTKQDNLSDSEEPMEFVELATIDGKTYDEIKIEIKINGRDKVVRVHEEGHSMSHALSWDLGVGVDATPERLVAAVAELLPEPE